MSEEQIEFKITDRRGEPKEAPKKVEVSAPTSTQANPQAKNIKTSPLFANLLMSLTTSALVFLGAMPDPSTGLTELNPEAAKQQLDLLLMLKEKTEGNRSVEENRVIDEALYEIHRRFVELTKK